MSFLRRIFQGFHLTDFHAGALLFVWGFLLYAHTLPYGFVWDDHYLVEQNFYLRHVENIPRFFTEDFWKNTAADFKSGFYRPVTLLVYSLSFQIWQGSPAGFHFLNIVLHSLNGVLIFFLFLRLTGDRWTALLTAVFFVSHPVQTEVVSFIADLGDILAVLFLLAMLLGYVRYISGRGTWRCYAGSAACWGMALLSKENAMTGAALLPFLDFFFVSRGNVKTTLHRWPVFIPYIAALAVYLAARGIVLGPENMVTTLGSVRYVSVLPAFDWGSHLLTTAKIIFLYVQMAVWPIHQSISYVTLPAAHIFELDVFFAVVFLFSLAMVMLLALRSSHRVVSFAIGWFFLTILPMSNLVPISNTIAERFMYLPMAGLSFLAAHIFRRCFVRSRGRRRAGILGILVLIIIILTFKSVAYSRRWQSDYTLFSSVRSNYACAPIAHLNLAVYYRRKGDAVKAAEEDTRYRSCRAAISLEYQRLQALRKNSSGER